MPCCIYQAWNYMETMASVALVLALVPLQKFPIDFCLALSIMKFQF